MVACNDNGCVFVKSFVLQFFYVLTDDRETASGLLNGTDTLSLTVNAVFIRSIRRVTASYMQECEGALLIL